MHEKLNVVDVNYLLACDFKQN